MKISMKQLLTLTSVINAISEIYEDFEYNIITTEDGNIVLTASDYFEFNLLGDLQQEFKDGLIDGQWDTITIFSQK